MAEKDTIQEHGWIDRMLDLYSEGRSDIEVCRDLGITRKQFDNYMATSTAFKDLVDRGRDYAQAHWFSQARTNIKNKEFMTELFKFWMVNNYGWSSSKADTKRDPNEAVNLDKLKEELKNKMPELALLLGEPMDGRKLVNESGKKH